MNDDLNDIISGFEKIITIRFKARNANKGITTIDGLESFNLSKEQLTNFCKLIKKKLARSCNINKETETLQIQGNCTNEIAFLIINELKIKNINIL